VDHHIPQFETRMSDAESLMWRLEKDPFLSSTFSNVTVLDAPVDFERFRRRMDRATRAVPRLRQRVQPAPGSMGSPSWVSDPDFDLNNHVRRVALPTPGTMRQLLDLATLISADAFDRTRPLWQFTIVDGLAGGRSALIQKLHHTIVDGQGGVALSMQFLDLERYAADPPPIPESESSSQADGPAGASAVASTFADAARVPLEALRQIREVLADPTNLPALGEQASKSLRSLLVEIGDSDAARSPLWTKRSLHRRVETLRVGYRPMLEASRALGGKLNTAFLTAAADAAGLYHRLQGSPVESLRTSLAISTRGEGSGGNAFTLARLLVPTAEMPIAERFAAINESVGRLREGGGGNALDSVARMAAFVPTSVLTRIARAQAQTVDFATSNVRGAGVPLYVAGAMVTENYPLGPLGGVAFNVTMLSYNHSLDMSLHVDTAAVAEPELLRSCLQRSLNAFTDLAPRAAAPVEASEPTGLAERARRAVRSWRSPRS